MNECVDYRDSEITMRKKRYRQGAWQVLEIRVNSNETTKFTRVGSKEENYTITMSVGCRKRQ